jgi:hypothetical protein
MTELLIASEAGRRKMILHLHNDHGIREGTRGVLKLLDVQELTALWWLHDHEIDETEINCEKGST